ncbi:hypothetical protein Ancab_004736 [Ancistrocladus abbreviatus]
MDVVVNPTLSQWIDRATACTGDLNIDELKATTRGTYYPDIEVGMVIDRKLREPEMLIAEGQRISVESKTRGYERQEINFIVSAVEDVKGKIWKAVSEEGVGTICIHGIDGVGKIATATTINNRALRETGLFDFVIWVDVSNCADLQGVQEDIASIISRKLPTGPNTGNRANKLSTALTGKKKFLVILDSMWQGYSPSDIGIPELTRGCKLIVTSRIHPVHKLMGGVEPFVIEPLINKDGWTLFKRELGVDNLSKLSSEILITRAKNATQDLQGVSSVIKNLAQTLENICQKNPQTPIDAEWKEELDCLSRSATFLENRNRPGSLEEMRSNGRVRLKELLNTSLLESASENCLHLRYLPTLSNLNRLNVLDLCGTQLVQWPKDMDMLTKLRHLDLTQAKLDIFPVGCICRYNQLEELLMMWDIKSRGCVWGSNELRDWNGACVEWLSDLGHLADLQPVFLNVMVFNSYMNACPKTTDGYAITTTCFRFVISDIHSAGVKPKSHENSIVMIGDRCIVLPEGTSMLSLMNCLDDSVDDRQALHFKNLTRIGVWMCGLLHLPDHHGVRDDNVIEIKGEREWWDAFQQHNPGIFDGCLVRFKEVLTPPNVSSSPRFTEVSDTFLSSPSNDAEQVKLMLS